MGNGKGDVYGDVRCGVECGNVCLMADSDVGKLQRWSIASDGLQPMPALTVDTSVGLPPVAIGAY
jgi:hypothetical protein